MIHIVLLTFLFYMGNAAFFDPTDIDDPLALFWNTKDTIIASKQKNCTTGSNGLLLIGVCKHISHCLLTGGRPHGPCGILSTCCTYGENSCVKSTNSKMSYFRNPENPLQHTQCLYTVNVQNSNVCQVRLDFENFHLTPATKATGIEDSYKCTIDFLSISPNLYNIPTLCGTNDKQHVYIHLEPSIKHINLAIHLGSRTTNNGAISYPSWQIKITQLECPRSVNLIQYKHTSTVNDFDLLAPVGAIQYFTEKTGRIRSFGLNPLTFTNSYTEGERYAIAFRRLSTICSIQFTPTYFKLQPGGEGSTQDDLCTTDYLFIPELNNGIPQGPVAKLCGGQSLTFTSSPPGPFYIHFISGATQVGEENDWGFEMIYEFVGC